MQPVSYMSECENKQREIPKMLPDDLRGAFSALMSSSGSVHFSRLWSCLQCERKPDCSTTAVFHITNTSLQTEMKFSQPLEFTLCAQQKVLHGLDLPGPGEGALGRNVWNWRLEKICSSSSIFSRSEWLSKWKWFISQGIWLCTWSRTNSRGLIFVSEVKDLAMSRGDAAWGGCQG